MKDLFSDTNKIGLWFFPLNFRYVEKIKKTSRWCRNCRIHVVRVILKPRYGWLVMNKSCFVLSWNFLWVFWIFLSFSINVALLANISYYFDFGYIIMHTCSHFGTHFDPCAPLYSFYLYFQTLFLFEFICTVLYISQWMIEMLLSLGWNQREMHLNVITK